MFSTTTARKIRRSFFHLQTLHSPFVFIALVYQPQIFQLLPLICFFQPTLPWHRLLQHGYTCLFAVNHSKMSDLFAVISISCGHFVLPQSVADDRHPPAPALSVAGLSFRTKLLNVIPFCTSRYLFLSFANPSASTANTLLWRQVCLSSAKAVFNADSICSPDWLARPLHREYTDSSNIPKAHRLVGIGRTPHTGLSRTLIFWLCIDLISFHDKRLFHQHFWLQLV